MPKMLFNSCCFCVDLREGVKALGVACILANALGLLLQVVRLYLPGVLCQLALGVASVLPVAGAAQRKRAYLVPWMGLYGLAAVTVSGVALHQAVAFGRHLLYLYISIGLPLASYALMVALSLYLRLGDPADDIGGYDPV